MLFLTDRHCITGHLRIEGVVTEGPLFVLDETLGVRSVDSLDFEPELVFGGVPQLKLIGPEGE